MNVPIVDMELPKGDSPKLPDMVMCGDHPSLTKPEVTLKEAKLDDKERDKAKERIMSYAKISPTASRTDRVPTTSEHALRLMEVRRFGARMLPLEATPRSDFEGGLEPRGNRALVQAALGSFRWPPYLLAVWVLVLLLTHVLHCIVNMLERALPALKKFCQYFRAWTEESWKSETELNQRVYPLGLACVTGLLYGCYCGLFAVYCVALWAVEPLSDDDKHGAAEGEPRITNYEDDTASKTSTFKQ